MTTSKLPEPGLPYPRPCVSLWQRQTRQTPHLNQGGDDPLPDSTDIVVIGSGLSGARTSLALLERENAPKDMVMLEAREACSGASGRNAGHCRPDAFRGFTMYNRVFGAKAALQILDNEEKVLNEVSDFVSSRQVQCDFDLTTTFDVIMGKDFKEYVDESFTNFKNAGGDISGISVYSGEEAKKVTKVNSALGAYEWKAASLNPAKLCHHIIRECLNKGMKLYTHTPVVNVIQSPNSTSSNPEWIVQTQRGAIRTKKVLHATNAFAATLLPQLKGLLVPFRGQAHAVVPTKPFAAKNMLTHTYSLRWSLHDFLSVIQRKFDGKMVVGTSRTMPGLSSEALASLESKIDDNANLELQAKGYERFKSVFPSWGTEAPGEGLEFGWTGIIAMTNDSVPFIGNVPSLPGQYVCAGFNGHGMARIFTCAPGVAKLMMGKEWNDTGLPDCFQMTQLRVKHLQEDHNIPRVW